MLDSEKFEVNHKNFELIACKYNNYFKDPTWNEAFKEFEQKIAGSEVYSLCPPKEAKEFEVSNDISLYKKGDS